MMMKARQCCNYLQECFVEITVCVLRSNAIEKDRVHYHEVRPILDEWDSAQLYCSFDFDLHS